MCDDHLREEIMINFPIKLSEKVYLLPGLNTENLSVDLFTESLKYPPIIYFRRSYCQSDVIQVAYYFSIEECFFKCSQRIPSLYKST